jgi:branched-chain amino acid aminotransferase
VIVNDKVIEKNEVNLQEIILNDFSKITVKVWFGFGGIPLFHENIHYLIEQSNQLNIVYPEVLKNRNEIFRLTKRMLNKNKFYRSGYITISIFYNQKKSHLVITSSNFETFDFPFSKNGILLNISDFKKPIQKEFSEFESLKNSLDKMLIADLQNTSYQNSIILNEYGKVCECIGANIFCIHKNNLITPSAKSGCNIYTTRKLILECGEKTEMNIIETDQISMEEIYKMDELFLASETIGITWVLGVNEKRFVKNKVKEIWEKVNLNLEEKAV